MSINVNTFNKKKARLEVRSCPEIVRDYVKLLEESNNRWEDLTKTALKKLKEKQPTPHKCRFCGAMTTQPDEQCFKANGESFANAVDKFRSKFTQEELDEMFRQYPKCLHCSDGGEMYYSILHEKLICKNCGKGGLGDGVDFPIKGNHT